MVPNRKLDSKLRGLSMEISTSTISSLNNSIQWTHILLPKALCSRETPLCLFFSKKLTFTLAEIN